MTSTGRADMAEQLLTLARSTAAGDRDRLLIAIADICNVAGEAFTPPMQALLQDVFMGLVVNAERSVRKRLAEILAPTSWAPHDLVATLANDEIEIARPVIALSPVLGDHDLIGLLVNATIEHRIEVARRPSLDRAVVQVVMDKCEPELLAVLADNVSADISPLILTRLVHLSKRMAALRAPLTRHPGLTFELAGLLYSWVGETLRSVLAARFSVEGPAFDAAVDDAVQEVGGLATAAPDPVDALQDRVAMEQRLVEKLQAAHQLRAGLLIRALQEGKLTLFKTGLAALGGLSAEDVGRAVDADRPGPLAFACSACGIDRSVFPTVLRLVRELNGDRPGTEETPTAVDLEPNSEFSSAGV